MEVMAESNTITAVEAQIAQLNAQVKEVIEIFQLSPDSRPIFTDLTLECFAKAFSKTTEDLGSHRQRWTEETATIDERGRRLEQEKKNLEKKEEPSAEENAAELKNWEERLAERESDVNTREKFLTKRTRAVDRWDISIERLAKNARAELERVPKASITLDERRRHGGCGRRTTSGR